jgi:HEAT repeat protein
MSNSSDVKNKPASHWLELFKAASMFLSSVVIALASFCVTKEYNSKQLAIATNKDLSVLIPRLGSPNSNEQRFAAISLGLYGKEAIPALIAVLDDPRERVGYAAEKSLTLIGDDAIPELMKTYKNRRSSPSLRGWCLFTLGELRAPKASPLALEALRNIPGDPNFTENAATALGLLQDTTAIPALLTALQKCKDSDSTLASTIFWALDNIWAMGKIGRDTIVETLSKVEASDSSLLVRSAAHDGIERYKRTH